MVLERGTLGAEPLLCQEASEIDEFHLLFLKTKEEAGYYLSAEPRRGKAIAWGKELYKAAKPLGQSNSLGHGCEARLMNRSETSWQHHI